MRAPQQHRCTVEVSPRGTPYLAFEPADGARPAFSNSHFTLDLRDSASVDDAHQLAAQINALLFGVSTTIF